LQAWNSGVTSQICISLRRRTALWRIERWAAFAGLHRRATEKLIHRWGKTHVKSGELDRQG